MDRADAQQGLEGTDGAQAQQGLEKMKEQIRIELPPTGEKMVRESFGVPHALKKIHISVKRPAEFEGAGFLAVYDEKQRLRLQKMLAYGEQELGIGEQAGDTSIGGVPGSIGEGTWTLLYGSLVSDWDSYQGTFPVTIEIQITGEAKVITEPMEQPWLTAEDAFHINEQLFAWGKIHNSKTAWFKGDFHTHTRLSDGKETVENAMKKAADMQLDFYVPTEHNLVHTGWTRTEMLILPGVEITAPLGHFNLFGITERPRQLDALMLADSEEKIAGQMQEIVLEANQKNWIVSVNHPFLHIWKWLLDDLELERVQCLEIVNDPTYPYAAEANERAISFLDALWEDGHRIYGVGGSDAHNLTWERYEGATEPSIAGDPGTFVYCSGLSAEHLLDGVRAGHVVVTRHCCIVPRLYGEEQTYLPGDEIKERSITYELEISGVSEYPEVYLVGNGELGEIIKAPVSVIKKPNGTYLAKKRIKTGRKAWRWFRMEVRDTTGNFMGYTNPVYTGKRESRYRTFGEAKKAWEERQTTAVQRPYVGE